MKTKLLLLIFSIVCSTALYADDLRGDTIDIKTIAIKADLSDFVNKVLYGETTLGIKAKKNGVGGIHLDLLELSVDSVFVNGANRAFAYNDSVIDIGFATTLNNNDSATISIFYHGKPLQTVGDFGGFFWSNTTAFNIGVSFLSDQHCFGRVWFPCFDNFTERSYYQFYITTQNGYRALCNGLLVDTTVNTSTTTWHWKLRDDIPSYLASVAVSQYAVLIDTIHGMRGVLPVQLAAHPTDTNIVKHLFQHLHDDLHYLEKLWGPYEWERVGYCIVPFNGGAMEHATNISLMLYYITSLASECEQTIAHELSHHWFGDLVTCEKASEMWLNEGWASYNEYLFFENVYHADSAKKEQRTVHQNVLQNAHIYDDGYLPVNGVPSEATYSTTVYRKGSDVIHTLRYYMGDSLFFNSVKSYLQHYKFQSSNTLLLRDYLMQQSGLDLTDYFDDWVQAPGFPHFSIEHKEVTSNGTFYNVQLQVRQRLSHAPHYYNHVPVTISYFGKDMMRHDERIILNGECAEHTTTLNFNPAYIAVDFDENLQDAISDEWQIIKGTGTYNMNIGLMKVQVNAITDSVLLRIEHNWIGADAMYNPIPDLHLHNYRYWTVDGIFDTTFKANATITYDGTPTAYLDSSFINNSEDSIVMMYRPEQDSDWVIADSFRVYVQGSVTNKKGYITIYNLKKGEYAMAIYNTNEPTETNTRITCKTLTGIDNVNATQEIKLYPNPASDIINVQYEANTFNRIELFDLVGRKIAVQRISSTQNLTELNLNDIIAGSYFVKLTAINGQHSSKKFIKQ